MVCIPSAIVRTSIVLYLFIVLLLVWRNRNNTHSYEDTTVPSTQTLIEATKT